MTTDNAGAEIIRSLLIDREPILYVDEYAHNGRFEFVLPPTAARPSRRVFEVTGREVTE